MKITELLATIRRIKGTFSDGAASLILNGDIYRRGEKPAPDQLLRAIHDLVRAQVAIEQDEQARIVLNAFDLGAIVDRKLPETLQAIAAASPPSGAVWAEALSPISWNWRTMVAAISPIEQLTVPNSLQEDQRPSDVLTIMVIGDKDSVSPKSISTTLDAVDALYTALQSTHPAALDNAGLEIIKIESGTSVRIDFRGSGEIIGEARSLLVSVWRLIRRRKVHDTSAAISAVMDGLDAIERIRQMEMDSIISSEDASRMIHQIFTSTTDLLKVGSLPREATEPEIVDNTKLLDFVRQRSLPPASEPASPNKRPNRSSSRKHRKNGKSSS